MTTVKKYFSHLCYISFVRVTRKVERALTT